MFQELYSVKVNIGCTFRQSIKNHVHKNSQNYNLIINMYCYITEFLFYLYFIQEKKIQNSKINKEINIHL